MRILRALVLCLFATTFTIPSADAQVLRWSMESDELGSIPEAVAVSPDGTLGAVAFPHAIQVFDLKSGELIRRVTSENIVRALCFSPMNRLFYGSEENIYELTIPTGGSRLVADGGFITPIKVIRATDELIAAASDSLVVVWKMNGTATFALEARTQIHDIDLSTANNFVVISDGSALIKATFNNSTSEVDLGMESNFRLGLTADNSTVMIFKSGGDLVKYNYTTGVLSLVKSLKMPDGDASFSGNAERLLLGTSASMQQRLSTIDCKTGEVIGSVDLLHLAGLRATDQTGDRAIVTSFFGLSIVSLPGTITRSQWAHTNSVGNAAFSHDGNLGVTSSTREAKIWDLQRGIQLDFITDDISPEGELVFSMDDSRILVPRSRGTYAIFDRATSKIESTIRSQNEATITATDVVGDKLWVAYSDGDLVAIDLNTLQEVKRLTLPFIANLIAIHDNLLAADDKENIIFWDLASNSKIKDITNGDKNYSLAFSDDGTKLLIGAQGGSSILNIQTLGYTVLEGLGSAPVWLSDESLLAVDMLGDSSIRSMDLRDPLVVTGHQLLNGRPTTIALSADRRMLLVGSYEGRLQLFALPKSSVDIKTSSATIAYFNGSSIRPSVDAGDVEATTSDALGRVVDRQRISIDQPLEVASLRLSAGVYFTTVRSSQGSSVIKWMR